jgi:hypothetical protein
LHSELHDKLLELHTVTTALLRKTLESPLLVDSRPNELHQRASLQMDKEAFEIGKAEKQSAS